MNIAKHLQDRIQGKAKKGQRRSSKWRKFRGAFKAKNPNCAVCGSKKKVEVHHKIPFHYAPDLELNKENLISLCENKKYGIHCHLLIGHLGNYRRFNYNIEIDAMTWNQKIQNT
jgi:5-methylcytosine-specific restriction protein A